MSKLAIFLLSDSSVKYQDFINKLDNDGYEVHLTENIEEIYPEYACEYLLNLAEGRPILGPVILVSDIKALLLFSYRMFNLCFSEFIWLVKNEESIFFEGIYKEISSLGSMEEDFVKGKIKLCIREGLSEDTLKFIVSDGHYRYFASLREEYSVKITEDLDLNYPYRKEYIFEKSYYSLGSSEYKRRITLQKHNTLIEPDLDRELLEFLIKNPLVLQGALDNQTFPMLKDILFDEFELYAELGLTREDISVFLQFIDGYPKTENQNLKVYLYSLLLKRYKKQEDFGEFIDFLMDSSLDFYKIRFIYSQLIYFVFMREESMENDIAAKIHLLYRHLIELARETFREELSVLEMSVERKKGNILIFCGQFLEENHAPTRRLIDYAAVYKNELNKNVLIINTAEMNRYIEMSYEGAVCVNYQEAYDSEKVREMLIGEREMPFYQIHSEYEDKLEIKYVLEQINDFAPEYILTVGDSNILADLCSRSIPVANLPCGTGLTVTEGDYYVLLRKMQKMDEDLLRRIRRSKEDIIESVYTFRKPKTECKRTKSDFGIGEEDFCLCIVGNRLNEEINAEMLHFLKKAVEKTDITVVVVGDFSNYEQSVRLSNIPREKMVSIGYQKDIMAVYAAFDACFNPKRNGGGSSVAQAMLAGLPIISLKTGDGAHALGMDQCFDSDEQMIEEMEKLKYDKAYYKQKSELVRERAQVLFDTNKMIKELDEKIRKKIGA